MFERTLTVALLLPVIAGCSSSPSSPSTKLAGDTTDASTPDAGGELVPLPGTTRFSMAMDSFTIKPNEEFYKCQDFPNPAGKDIAILQSESVMTRGSHHMFAFRLDTTQVSLNLATDGSKGPLVDCPAGGVEAHPYFHDAQIPKRLINYPPGIGRSLKATEGVRLMVHYFNTTPDVLTPSLQVTADYVDASAVDTLAAEYFLNAFGVSVKPGKTTQTFAYTFPSAIHVLSAVGHMHRHGIEFEADELPPGAAATAPGDVLYTSDQWLEPTPADFVPAKDVAAGTTFRFTCTYQNDDGQTFTFGESAQKNEMCIFQGTFYPAPNGAGILGMFGSSQ